MEQETINLDVKEWNQIIKLDVKELIFININITVIFNNNLQENKIININESIEIMELLNNLPDSLKILNLIHCDKFNIIINPNKLPKSITHLLLNHDFNHSVDNLPNSITHLTLGCYFNQPINNLPNSITHLTLGYYFNQPVDMLPNSITHLVLNNNFNQSVDMLPNSLIELSLGNNFNQPIDSLPNSIKYLKISSYAFNFPIDNLPNSLTHLTLGCKFNQSLDKLPDSLTYLSFGTRSFFNQYVNKLPKSIELIDIDGLQCSEKYIFPKKYHKLIKKSSSSDNYYNIKFFKII